MSDPLPQKILWFGLVHQKRMSSGEEALTRQQLQLHDKATLFFKKLLAGNCLLFKKTKQNKQRIPESFTQHCISERCSSRVLRGVLSVRLCSRTVCDRDSVVSGSSFLHAGSFRFGDVLVVGLVFQFPAEVLDGFVQALLQRHLPTQRTSQSTSRTTHTVLSWKLVPTGLIHWHHLSLGMTIPLSMPCFCAASKTVSVPQDNEWVEGAIMDKNSSKCGLISQKIPLSARCSTPAALRCHARVETAETCWNIRTTAPSPGGVKNYSALICRIQSTETDAEHPEESTRESMKN